MVDGASSLITSVHAGLASGGWRRGRASNVLDTGAHFYDAYETLDGKYIALGSIEPQFYAEFLRLLGLEGETAPPPARPHPLARTQGARLQHRAHQDSRRMGSRVRRLPTSASAPSSNPGKLPTTPHAKARGAFEEVAGVVQPRARPTLQRQPLRNPGPDPPGPGQHTDEILAEIGLNGDTAKSLKGDGAVA